MRSRLTETINNCTAEIAAAAFDTFVGDSAYDTFGIKLTRRRGFPSLIEYTVVGTDIDQRSNIVVGESERGTIRFQTLPGDRVEVSIEILPPRTNVGQMSAVSDTTLHKLFDNAVNHLRSLAPIQSPESGLSAADKHAESGAMYPTGRFVKNAEQGLFMSQLPSDLYNHCRTTLLKCSEFDSSAALRSVFVIDELSPFRDGLPEAASKSERVNKGLAYLLDKRLSDGRPVLPLFLEALSDRYQAGDALRDELRKLAEAVQSALALPDLSSTAVHLRQRTAPATYNTEAVRDMLTAAFDDERLTILCYDHFRPVYDDFSVGMSKRHKIQRLLDYCERHAQVEKLLTLIEKHNPDQYARFKDLFR